MIVYRAGQSFRIDIAGSQNADVKNAFADARIARGLTASVAADAERATLEFRRWWAERQPEVRWAQSYSTGLYVVDVSTEYWRDKCFALTFDAPADAATFARIFLGLEQVECEAVMADRDQRRP